MNIDLASIYLKGQDIEEPTQKMDVENIVDVCCRILKEFRYWKDGNEIHKREHSEIYTLDEVYEAVSSNKLCGEGIVTKELVKEGLDILAQKYGLLMFYREGGNSEPVGYSLG